MSGGPVPRKARPEREGRIERKRARQCRALAHPAAQACRVAVFVAGETDQRELESRELGPRGGNE